MDLLCKHPQMQPIIYPSASADHIISSSTPAKFPGAHNSQEELFMHYLLAISGTAFYLEGRWFYTHLVHALPSLSRKMATYLCMEWAFGQSHALDNQPNRQWDGLTTLISYARWNIWQGQAETSSLGSNTPDSKFALQPSTPHLPALPSALSFLAAIMVMVYLHFTQQSSSHRCVATPINEIPIGSRYGNCPQPLCWVQSVKSWKSCSCWITAIIQQLWDTAWDLTTHWNVEIIAI